MDNEQTSKEKESDEGSSGWSFVGEIEEYEHIDINGNGEDIDDYWAKGWLSGFVEFRRFNVDSYADRAYKVYPTRYRLKDFRLSKSQRRLLKKNQSLHRIIRPLRITEGKSNLYRLYYEKRHNQPNARDVGNVYDYIRYYPASLMELCIFNEKKLIAYSIFQVGNDAISSDLAVWDLDEKRNGLGIMTVLLEMEYGRKLGLSYYYLGHYFRKNPNYQYKTRFSGLELYDWENERWIDYQDEAAEILLSQKLISCSVDEDEEL